MKNYRRISAGCRAEMHSARRSADADIADVACSASRLLRKATNGIPAVTRFADLANIGTLNRVKRRTVVHRARDVLLSSSLLWSVVQFITRAAMRIPSALQILQRKEREGGRERGRGGKRSPRGDRSRIVWHVVTRAFPRFVT